MKRDTGNKSQNAMAGTCTNTSDRFRMEAMQTSTRTGLNTSGTDREFKFKDQHDEPAIIPDTWAEQGVHESGDGERFYAVEVRVGLRLEFTVDHSGQPIKGPHTDEPGIQTLYVTADGGRAVVLESRAEQLGDGLEPHDQWRSVLADPTAEVSTVTPERRDAYRSLIQDLYEVSN